MSKNEFVSIIIPVYNGSQTLTKCLKSVSNQTYSNYEVVVIDNNSTDDTKLIISDFERECKKIKYVFEPKKGRGFARNAGIKTAKGTIIAMTDSDCIVPNNWVERITHPIRDGEAKAVMGFEKQAISNYWSDCIQESQEKFYKNDKGNSFDTKCCAIKASLIRELKFDSNLKNCEDFELSLRLKKEANILFDNTIVVKHYHKQTGIDIFKLQIDRGYWCYKIYKKHPHLDEPMFKSFKFRKNLLSLPHLLVMLVRDYKRFPYVLISETGWRIGFIQGLLRINK